MACEREVEGDLFLWDLGEGLGFRPGAFDGAISVSALQWLCNADRKDHHPPKRLYLFFSSLYACLVSPLIISGHLYGQNFSLVLTYVSKKSVQLHDFHRFGNG